MEFVLRYCELALVSVALLAGADSEVLSREAGWIGDQDFFAEELWPKVGARTCLNCHKTDGVAGRTRFILHDPSRDPGDGQQESLERNRAAFAAIAKLRENDRSLPLLKVSGEVRHGGGALLKAGSIEYQILDRFIQAVNGELIDESLTPTRDAAYEVGPLLDSISMIDDRKLLRRLTLNLTGRLPTDVERRKIRTDGIEALGEILDQLMTEEAFYDRLAEGFNDILLTRGYDGLPERALSYEHFGTTRHWPQDLNLTGVGDKAAQNKFRKRLISDYQEGMLREPTELIKYIVRNNRPFTEIVTGDYIMVSPYTSLGYGVDRNFQELSERFKNPDNGFEFVPVRLASLRSRGGQEQESKTGFYPHAGLLSSFQYLMRYPTTETNRNRLRARMFYQNFLGVDVMQLAPRVNDAVAISVRYKKPTMEAPDCVVCHQTLDPVAGLFQDYYVVDAKGVYGPREFGWFKDMFLAGFEGENLPKKERWRSLQWLGERTARDPRFAVAMVEHVFYILTGHRPLLPPEDVAIRLYDARRRAYQEQRSELEATARRFAESNFNLKVVFQQLAHSKFHRAYGTTSAIASPSRAAELEALGVVHLLTPEQLERKLKAIFGQNWGRLEQQFKILYGGIDSKTVTERNSVPNGAMGALQRMMANEMACRVVPTEFTADPESRRLFPNIEPDLQPGESEADDQRIREVITYLHQRILGRYDSSSDPEVMRTYGLFEAVVREAQSRGQFDQRELYACRGADNTRVDDPLYTVRAWRAVVTYLLRQQEFLYE